MKKLTSILVVFVIVFHLFGYFAVFKVMQRNIKKEIKTAIKQGVPDSELAYFRFPVNKKIQEKMGIRWLESNEFTYKGNMYDVVHKQYDGEFIIFKCVNDTQEKILFTGLNKQVKNTMNNDPAKSKTLNLLQKFSFVYITQSKDNNGIIRKEVLRSYYYKPKYFYNLPIEVITPPPQFS